MGLISIGLLLFIARHFLIILNENKKTIKQIEENIRNIKQIEENEKKLIKLITEQQNEIDELKKKIK